MPTPFLSCQRSLCFSGHIHLFDIYDGYTYFDSAISTNSCTDVQRHNLGLILFKRTTTKRGNYRLLRKFIFTRTIKIKHADHNERDQDGRVVKALDLSSNGRIVRVGSKSTPGSFFLLFLTY